MTNQTQLKDNVLAILKDKYPCSILELAELLGHKNSRRFIQCLREINGLEELLKKNVVIKELESPNKPSTTPRKVPKKSARKKSKYPHHPQNPYRVNSGYALVFDILASHENGMRRDQLIKLYAKETGKKIGNGATWDVSISLSPTEDGRKHRSAKDSYWVEKENDFVKLHIRN